MLSFEANKAAYETEINRAIRVMYLAYWIGNVGANLQAKVNALGAAKDNTISEIEDSKVKYSEATARIPMLEAESAALTVDEQRRLEDLKWLEKRLEARAQANVEDRHRVPEWKKSLGVAAAICKVVPVYQPALAAVGTGLDAVANYDPQNPMATVASGSSGRRTSPATCSATNCA